MTDNGVVGWFGGTGMGEGRFVYPRAIDTGPQGCIFVVDKTGRIQRFSPDGKFELSWTMPKTDTGLPVGLSFSPDGRLFVADTHNHRVMVFDRDGHKLASFGELGEGDGQFQLPTDVAFDAQGRIYVGEYYENDRVTRWNADYSFDRVVVAGDIEGKPVLRPAGLVIDGEQTLWVADACNHRLLRFTLDGKLLQHFGGFGDNPGQVRYPYDLCLAPDHTIMVSEYEGNRLQWFDKQGKSLRCWGRGGRALGQLSAPWGATYGHDGRIYVLDSRSDRVQIIQP